jgi:hypothetical protein
LLVLIEEIAAGSTDGSAYGGTLPAGAEDSSAQCSDCGTGAGALLRLGHGAAGGEYWYQHDECRDAANRAAGAPVEW